MAAVLRGAKEPFAPSLYRLCAQILPHDNDGYIMIAGVGVSHLAPPTPNKLMHLGDLSHRRPS